MNELNEWLDYLRPRVDVVFGVLSACKTTSPSSLLLMGEGGWMSSFLTAYRQFYIRLFSALPYVMVDLDKIGDNIISKAI